MNPVAQVGEGSDRPDPRCRESKRADGECCQGETLDPGQATQVAFDGAAISHLPQLHVPVPAPDHQEDGDEQIGDEPLPGRGE